MPGTVLGSGHKGVSKTVHPLKKFSIRYKEVKCL